MALVADVGPGLAADRSTSAPLDEQICEVVCWGFALWTLCCYAVVALGGTLEVLMLSFAVASLLAIGCLYRFRRRSPVLRNNPPDEAPGPRRRGSHRRRVAYQAAVLVVALIGLLLTSRQQDAVLTWWWFVAVLALAAVVIVSEQPVLPEPVRARRLEVGLWVLGLVCVVLTLVSHRPDADDAHYVNIAVAAVDDAGGWPLLSGDTMHGIEGLPMVLPVYRFHSYEIWIAALSWMTRIPAIYCFHWIMASLTALLVPFAYARLFRLLTPRTWLWSVAVLIFLLFAIGETHRWYGNFAFVRMWQGKGFFLFVFLPLIYAYGMEFAQRPGWRTWSLLCAAQIAAIGCSSSAIWGAPIGAVLAVASALPLKRRSLRVLGFGLVSTVLVLGAGWLMKQKLAFLIERLAAESSEPGEELRKALTTVFGGGDLLAFCMACVLVTWTLCPRGVAQRFAIIAPLAVALVLLNPHLANRIMAHVTGPSYWRSLWALPVLLLMTLTLVSPLGWRSTPTARVAGRVVCLLSVALFAVTVPRFSALAEDNGVRIDWPSLKVPALEYQVAGELNAAAGPGAYVAAPQPVSVWIPTFHHHAYALRVRNYMSPIKRLLGSDNVRRRENMRLYLRGQRAPLRRSRFREDLDRFAVSGVCLAESEESPQTRTILEKKGFRRVLRRAPYEIWIRDRPVETPPAPMPTDGAQP